MKQPPQEKTPAVFLAAALLVTGASTLILEIVGTRVISPFYGASLHTWSALITVTLIALAAGYAVGGRQADRAPGMALFGRVVALAALAVAAIPWLRLPVLSATSALGIRLGALASAAILMAPALALLGATAPLAIKLATPALQSVGRAAGDMYALSTAGSVLGAILAGYVLVPNVGIDRILYGLSCVLMLTGAGAARAARGKAPWLRLAAAAAALLAALAPRAKAAGLIVSRESAYGQIKVMDHMGRRFLLVNGTSQAVARLEDFESDSPYLHVMEWAALVRPRARAALVIGAGAGLLPRALERAYGLKAKAVEIDPAMLETAFAYFRYAPDLEEVALDDGRAVLARAPDGAFDLMFLDAFGAELPPAHLFTREAFMEARRALAPDGVLSINLVSLVRGPRQPWHSVYKTLRAVFPHVRVALASQPYRGMGNIVFFCSSAPLEPAAAGKPRPEIEEALAFALANQLIPGDGDLARAQVLTDDFCPLESLLADTAVSWRRSLQEQLSDVMLMP